LRKNSATSPRLGKDRKTALWGSQDESVVLAWLEAGLQAWMEVYKGETVWGQKLI